MLAGSLSSHSRFCDAAAASSSSSSMMAAMASRAAFSPAGIRVMKSGQSSPAEASCLPSCMRSTPVGAQLARATTTPHSHRGGTHSEARLETHSLVAGHSALNPPSHSPSRRRWLGDDLSERAGALRVGHVASASSSTSVATLPLACSLSPPLPPQRN